MSKVFNINLDVKKNNYICLSGFKVGDNLNTINGTMLQSSVSYDLTGLTLRVNYRDSQGNLYFQDATKGVSIINPVQGTFKIDVLSSILAKEGIIKADISIFKGTQKLTSSTFSMEVVDTIYKDNAIVGTDGKDLLQEIIEGEGTRKVQEIEREKNEVKRKEIVQIATNSNTSLQDTINTSITKDNILKATIVDSIVKDNILNATVNDSVSKDNILKGTIVSSIAKDTALKETINDSVTKDNVLKGTIADSVIKDTVLKGTIAKAEDMKKDLESFTGFRVMDNVTPHFDKTLGEYIGLKNFWDSLRTGKKYTVEFNQFSLSPSPLGTKKDDNEGLICEPSTNILKGRNDYENIGLFMAIDVNAYVDANDDYHVTAIKGDGLFKNDGTNGDVYVMAMPGYQKRNFGTNTWSISYSDVMLPGYEIIHEAVKPDGTVRPYLLHAKYIAGVNPLDGKLASISGVNAEYNSMSHDGQIDQFKAKGIQYSGKTSHDDFYTSMMFYLKYATLNQETIMKGCIIYYLQYVNLVAETGVKRVILSNANANNLLIGSCVSIGDYQGSTKTDDRQNALNYNKANRAKIIKVEDLGSGNSAVYVDTLTTFDTTLTTTVTTYPWQTGSCDNVLGTDGSPYSNTSGKEPCIVNGIEFMVGGYEVIQNLIIYNDNTNPNNYEIKVYANYDCKTYNKGSTTSDYDLISYRLAQTNQAWGYISKIGIDSNNPSVIIPVEAGGSSTTGFADGVYTNTAITGYREWLSLGDLTGGSLCGLRCLFAFYGLSRAYWGVLGRLSATGRSQRRAGVN